MTPHELNLLLNTPKGSLPLPTTVANIPDNNHGNFATIILLGIAVGVIALAIYDYLENNKPLEKKV